MSAVLAPSRRLELPKVQIHIPGVVAAKPGEYAMYRDLELGPIKAPPEIYRVLSAPGMPTRKLYGPGEIGVVVAKRHRVSIDPKTGKLRRELLWADISHNERVDAGAAIQVNLLFGTSGTTANGVITAIAVVSGSSITKTKTDLSIGSASQGVTTNEFTASGLARVAGTVGTYTAPSTLGGQFTQVLSKVFTATASVTAYGSAVFDKVVVSASNLYMEDTFTSNAILQNGDTLTITWSELN